jgi:glycosyltransferase involved in cell wall biosynthesis
MPARTTEPYQAAAAGHASAPGHPTVSVVLPTYNRGALIGRSIHSVLHQTYQDFELIVVDDGSTDATMEAVDRVHDPRVRSVRLAENRGAGAARNVGIRRAAGRFIAFQDSDDEWVRVKLERHMRIFETCAPTVGVVYSDMHRIRRDGTTHYHRSPTIVSGALIDPRTRSYQVYRLGIQSSVIRSECFAGVGDFNEAFPALEDLELFIRLSQRFQFHHLTTPLVKYYETDGLSNNLPAKLAARTLLLQLYRTELEQEDMAFVVRESAALGLAEARGADGSAEREPIDRAARL